MSNYPNQAIFASSLPLSQVQPFVDAFEEVSRALGFRPVWYAGLTGRARESSADSQVRDDFYDSRAVVIYLDASGGDNWALPEVKIAMEGGRACFVYASPDFPLAILRQHGLADSMKRVNDAKEFQVALNADLGSVATPNG